MDDIIRTLEVKNGGKRQGTSELVELALEILDGAKRTMDAI